MKKLIFVLVPVFAFFALMGIFLGQDSSGDSLASINGIVVKEEMPYAGETFAPKAYKKPISMQYNKVQLGGTSASKPSTASGTSSSSSVSSNSSASAASSKTYTTPTILTDRVPSGIAGAGYQSARESLKFMQSLNGKQVFDNMSNDGKLQDYYMSMGTGNYTLAILYQISGNSYGYKTSTTAAYQQGGGQYAQYLSANREIKFNDSSLVVLKAKELTSGVANDEEKVKRIYNYVIKNYRYNYDALGKLPAGYVPDPDTMYRTGKGVCYDFSSMFAAMLRSQGVPTKMVKGSTTYTGSAYHAWNEVLVNGTWYSIDTSSDSIYYNGGYSYSMYKPDSAMKKTSEL